MLSSVACPAVSHFSTLSHKRHGFFKRKCKYEIVFYSLYNFFLKLFSFQEELSEILSQMYIGLYVKCPLFVPDLMKLKFSPQIFEKFSNIKFHENTSSGSRVALWGQTYGRTDRHDDANSRFSQLRECA